MLAQYTLTDALPVERIPDDHEEVLAFAAMPIEEVGLAPDTRHPTPDTRYLMPGRR